MIIDVYEYNLICFIINFVYYGSDSFWVLMVYIYFFVYFVCYVYCDKDFRFFFLISFFKKCKKFLGSIFGYMDKCFFYCVICYLLINIEG